MYAPTKIFLAFTTQGRAAAAGIL